MKLHKKCSGECVVCSFVKNECNPEDGIRKFARASKDELIRRLSDYQYTDDEKYAIRIWLRVQHEINI